MQVKRYFNLICLILFNFFTLYAQDTCKSLFNNAIPLSKFEPISTNTEPELIFYGEFHNIKNNNRTSALIAKKYFSSKSGKKVYFIEGGKSFEYCVNKYRNSDHYLFYKKRKIRFDTRLLKDFFKQQTDLLFNDTNITYCAFDLETSFSFALIVMYDILQNSGSSQFNNELHLMKKQFKLNKPNFKYYNLIEKLNNELIRDTTKYINGLSLMNYRYYEGIMKGLRQGIHYDSLNKLVLKKELAVNYREEIMTENLNNYLISNNTKTIFIQTGLSHTFDSIGRFYYSIPWISMAERVKKANNSLNIIKYGSVDLNSKYFYNYTMLNSEQVRCLKKKLTKGVFIIDAFSINFNKSKYSYFVIFN